MSTYVLDRTMPMNALLLVRALGALTTMPPSSLVGGILWAGYFGNVIVAHLHMIQA